jgi:hypothetical protein
VTRFTWLVISFGKLGDFLGKSNPSLVYLCEGYNTVSLRVLESNGFVFGWKLVPEAKPLVLPSTERLPLKISDDSGKVSLLTVKFSEIKVVVAPVVA